MASGLALSVKCEGEKPLKLMTHPSGQPCYLRENVGDRMVKLGWKFGYDANKKKGTSAFPDGDPGPAIAAAKVTQEAKAAAPAK